MAAGITGAIVTMISRSVVVAEAAVAAFAIVDWLNPMAFGVLFALSGSAGPIIGQNLGVKLIARLRQVLTDCVTIGAARFGSEGGDIGLIASSTLLGIGAVIAAYIVTARLANRPKVIDA